MNENEVAELNGIQIAKEVTINLDDLKKSGRDIFEKEEKPVFITCGNRGIITIDKTGTEFLPALKFDKKLDTVGAGDTTLSALALCLSAGYTPGEAAWFANLAAGVTVQKLFETGTASDKEILDLFTNYPSNR